MNRKSVRIQTLLAVLLLGWGVPIDRASAAYDDDDEPDYFGMFLTTVGAATYASTNLSRDLVRGAQCQECEERVRLDFIRTNYEPLRRDFATGDGEYARSLARLMKLPDSAVEPFLKSAHEHYPTLFPDTDDPVLLLSNLRALVPAGGDSSSQRPTDESCGRESSQTE